MTEPLTKAGRALLAHFRSMAARDRKGYPAHWLDADDILAIEAEAAAGAKELGEAYVECQRLLIDARAEAAPPREALAEALERACEVNGLTIINRRDDSHGDPFPVLADAILAALPAPRAEGLDVERLAAALDVLSDEGLEYDFMAPEEREDRDDAAARLAAEYARLQEQDR